MKKIVVRFLFVILLFLTSLSLWGQAKAVGGDFVEKEIDSAILTRIKGKSYKEGCAVPLSELRYLSLLHYDFSGRVVRGEMICHKSIAADLLEIFQALYEAQYPIERIRLIDDYDADDDRSMQANNTSCFNYRQVAGSRKLSKHSRGMAVDINPLYNPCVRTQKGRRTILPKQGKPYVNRQSVFPHKIDRSDLCYRLFLAHGFRWGGAWRSVKDYQHFEK